jgi:hypothetical protein
VSLGRGESEDDAQIFAQPWWVRGLNVVAAAAGGALLAAGAVTLLSPSLMSMGIAAVLLASSMWVGVRAMQSHVALAEDRLHYRGVVRSHTVTRSRILALSEPGPRFSTILIDVPMLVWRDDLDTIRQMNLWCLPVSADALVGVGQTFSARDELRLALGNLHP